MLLGDGNFVDRAEAVDFRTDIPPRSFSNDWRTRAYKLRTDRDGGAGHDRWSTVGDRLLRGVPKYGKRGRLSAGESARWQAGPAQEIENRRRPATRDSSCTGRTRRRRPTLLAISRRSGVE